MTELSKLTPMNLHLFNAYYAWLAENNSRIQITVNSYQLSLDDFLQRFASPEGHIILTVSPNSVRNLVSNESGVSFDATFAGQPRSVFVPLNAIEAMVGDFPNNDPHPIGFGFPAMDTPDEMLKAEPVKKRPTLSVVK